VKRALVIVGIVVAALGALGVRVVIEGRRAITAGDDALVQKRPLDAIASWESAARWYLPLAPHVDDAYARLVDLAKTDPKVALSAWRAVRSAAIATRSLWTPHADDLAAANAAIAKLSAEHPEGAPAAGQNVPDRTALYAERLAYDRRPSVGAAALAILGILSWLAGIAVVVVRGVDAAGRTIRRPAVIGLALSVAGILGWAAGLYNA
jgi:hypothetical protein